MFLPQRVQKYKILPHNLVLHFFVKKISFNFHDGSLYHTETSQLICWFLYDRDLRHERVKPFVIDKFLKEKRFQ